jgi:mannose-1-phosphate guanylyltransferase
MRAILLAAGVGSRLRPLTDTTPKCLAPVLGRPLMDYWIERLFPDFERVLINTHHLAEQVRAYVDASPWRGRIDLVHETELLGTGGTLAANRAWFGSGPALVAHADNLTDLDPAALLAAHNVRPAGCVMTMLAFETDDPRSCGILEIDKRSVVQAFHEKVENPPGILANAAVYVLEGEILDMIAALPGPAIDLSTEVIPRFLGRIHAVRHQGYHRDIGNLASLARANADFAERTQSKVS